MSPGDGSAAAELGSKGYIRLITPTARAGPEQRIRRGRCCGAARLHCGRNARAKAPSKMSSATEPGLLQGARPPARELIPRETEYMPQRSRARALLRACRGHETNRAKPDEDPSPNLSFARHRRGLGSD